MQRTRFTLLSIAMLLVAAPAMAGGPLNVCDCGVPFLWPNGGTNIPFNPDQGGLGILNNAQATQAVEDAFQAWEDVPSSTASYVNAGQLSFDVDATNFLQFLFPGVADGLSPIVFDDDGSIFNLLFGPGSGVLGFAGPDVFVAANCEIIEGAAFLNGPAIGTLEGLLDLMVHEFGHYTNLAHTIVNGQLFIGVGDTSGPEPNATFGFPPFPDGIEVIETMYPFLFTNIDQVARTPNPDDVAILSTLYPESNFFSTTGTITGDILAPNGTSPITGVNVIARNVADPFGDAVSAISSDFTDDFQAECCPVVGQYTINGLTPGATYAVYVDEIEAGGFSTPPASPLPGPEDFYNGAGETGDSSDDPSVFVGIVTAAGSPNTGIDILFNGPDPGDPLQVGDDGSVQLFLPFPFCVTGQQFDSVFVNANGNLTFGAGDVDFTESAGEHLDGPPRVAALWDDLSPFNLITGVQQGLVTFSETSDSLTVTFRDVPEFLNTGSNTFDITLHDNSGRCDVVCPGDDDDDTDTDSDTDSDSGSDSDSDSDSGGPKPISDVTITYGDLTATDGLAGVSGGLFSTNGVEPEVDLSSFGATTIALDTEAAAYELFTFGDANDLANTSQNYRVGEGFDDAFEENDSIGEATTASTPFDTIDTATRFSSIDPAAADVDYYKLRNLEAGQTVIAEVLRGQIDSVMGLFRIDDDDDSDSGSDSDSDSDVTGELVAFNDDFGGTLLSRIVFTVAEAGDYAVAVTFCCDFDFDGVDPGQGGPLDVGRYVLGLDVVDGVPITLGDDQAALVSFGFGFPFQGTTYNDVFVVSNGNLSFGSADTFFLESVGGFLGGPPRIAPLWDDLDPSAGGLVLAKEGTDCLKVSFNEVPEFGGVGSNTFSVTFDAAGNVQFDYGGLTAPDGLVGITPGNGAADPGESDLSAGGPFSNTGTTYENFSGGDNDLSGTTVVFGSSTSCGDSGGGGGGGDDDDSDSDSD